MLLYSGIDTYRGLEVLSPVRPGQHRASTEGRPRMLSSVQHVSYWHSYVQACFLGRPFWKRYETDVRHVGYFVEKRSAFSALEKKQKIQKKTQKNTQCVTKTSLWVERSRFAHGQIFYSVNKFWKRLHTSHSCSLGACPLLV